MDKFDANKLIDEREASRGSFIDVASAEQVYKSFSRTRSATITSCEAEALDNIFTKIARLTNRKSKHDLDSWQDIAGYATLVVNSIKYKEELDCKDHFADDSMVRETRLD